MLKKIKERQFEILSIVVPSLITTKTPPIIKMTSISTQNLPISLSLRYTKMHLLLLFPHARKAGEIYEQGNDNVIRPILSSTCKLISYPL